MNKLYIVIVILSGFLSLELTAGDFTDNGDVTVTDNVTGLMWQQANYEIGKGLLHIVKTYHLPVTMTGDFQMLKNLAHIIHKYI